MPAKYSHVKKRSASGLKRAAKDGQHGRVPNPHVDRSLSQAMSAVSQLERTIARILLLRYEHDMARLFSTRLYSIALVHLPTFVMRCITVAGPGWVAHNADCDQVNDFLRAALSMDMRQLGERVATKSVLWSYTALRHFAISNNVAICKQKGLHSLRLLPHYPALKSHLDTLEAMPPPSFSKPPHLGSLQEGQSALEEACELKYGRLNDRIYLSSDFDYEWKIKVRVGYEMLVQTLWRIAREFDVRGYGSLLRDKLTTKWCDCGCSTDHLGEVCEKTVREDEEESGVRLGKQKEWDGRGTGVYGWDTEDEEDIWEIDLDFSGLETDDLDGVEADMTIGELMEWRYLKAELEKEAGNQAFRKGNYQEAAHHYEAAHAIEPEVPHYQLNLAAAHLKLNKWIEAEAACTKALSQHRSGKGYYRRAKARKMLGRSDEAIRDLRAILKHQPNNTEALTELLSYLPASAASECSSASSSQGLISEPSQIHERVGIPKPKPPKPLPFPRTKVDARKLKFEFLENAFPSDQHHSCGQNCCRKVKKGPKTSAKGLELEAMKLGQVVYPNWDKYSVTVDQ